MPPNPYPTPASETVGVTLYLLGTVVLLYIFTQKSTLV